MLQSPGLAGFLAAEGGMVDAFRGSGAQHSDLLQQIPIFLINDREIAAKGALALSRALIPG
ncbi:hypothetical protein OIE66_42840 [Nonomuraea sp. NBC_01738]|uniref:hypothetical protein n=1 Tax=Nonomuraea sp. NBC_01738 TaxID=2976003 RepID=UPI002E0DB1B2|nr:hypothetical protein OIE66_42840 [Nonomuraea sp. NBC_01738]